MRIFNVRHGFATNSSSSHSLIFLPNQTDDQLDGFGEFGWQDFIAASREQKEIYVKVLIRNNLNNLVDKEITSLVLKGMVTDEEKLKAIESVDIDHQSRYALPRSWTGKSLDFEFCKELEDFFLQDNLVILGGNDNSYGHPLKSKGSFTLPLPQDCYPNLTARKDSKYNYWSIFNRDDGTKVRFGFKDTKEIPFKASAPELCDIKITDYCPYECDFCYQGSTAKGKHANLDGIYRFISTLAELKVWEIAYGGGEPTLHPDFWRIIKQTKNLGIVPNFTTRNLAWLKDTALALEAFNNIGGFAFSTENPADITALKQLMTDGKYPLEKCYVQYVMGSTPVSVFEDIFTSAIDSKINITLLGFKQDGRGEEFKQYDYSDWLNRVAKMIEGKYIKFGIDTALANESKVQLKKKKVADYYYEVKEGKFSMYFDAVKNKIGPASYASSLLMKRISPDLTANQLKNIFALF